MNEKDPLANLTGKNGAYTQHDEIIIAYTKKTWQFETLAFVRDFLRGYISEGTAILDIGCGESQMSKYLSHFCDDVKVVGFDVDLASLRASVRDASNADIAAGSTYHIPFRKGTFDLVIMRDVLEHLDKPDVCLREINRVTGPRGKIVLTTPNALYMNILHHRGPMTKYHVKEYTLMEVRKLLTSAGFHISKTMASNLPFLEFRKTKMLPTFMKRMLTPFTVGSFYVAAAKKR
jgi:ubiquinone/menaquinone biosynthesis C-methylase UbiE